MIRKEKEEKEGAIKRKVFEIAGKEANPTSLPWQDCFIHVGSCKGMLSAVLIHIAIKYSSRDFPSHKCMCVWWFVSASKSC